LPTRGSKMTTPIIKIKGIGPQTAEILGEHGFKFAEDLALSTEDVLRKVHGFGPSRAKMVIEAARALCEGSSDTTGKLLLDDDINVEFSTSVMKLEKKGKLKSKNKKKKKNKGDKKAKREIQEKKKKKAKKTSSKSKKKKK